MQFTGPAFFCELRSVFRTMKLCYLGACSNNLVLLMPRRYAETGFIRKASEERISNHWNKHSSLTQSSQKLKRGIEILSLFLKVPVDPMRTNLFICQFCEYISILIPTLANMVDITGTKGGRLQAYIFVMFILLADKSGNLVLRTNFLNVVCNALFELLRLLYSWAISYTFRIISTLHCTYIMKSKGNICA